MAATNDYGGNGYGRRPRSTKVRIGSTRSYRCRDCDKLRYLSNRELQRAARPRCLECGGTLIETVAEERRTVGTPTARKKAAEDMAETLAAVRKTPRCLKCGAGYISEDYLQDHVVLSAECREEYCRSSDLKLCRRIARGTAFCRQIGHAHGVFVIPAKGPYLEMARFASKEEAESLARKLNARS